MTEYIRDCLERHDLRIDDLFIIGVSGGPDSMALLHAFKELHAIIIAVHINYKKRAQSDHDENMVRLYCEKNQIKYIVEIAQPKQAKGNFQNWARDLRRSFFETVKNKHNGSAIVTAHHRDDQIETIMQKILRGSSLAGWKGIQEYDGTYFRPLLDISKNSLIAYAKQAGVPYAIDHTNLESEYARNFIRNEWKPELDRLYPGWEQNIMRLPKRAEEFMELLEIIINDVRESKTTLNRAGLLKLKPNALKAVILEVVRQNFPNERISASALENIDIKSLNTGGTNELSKNVSLIRDRDVITLIKYQDTDYQYDINLQELENKPLLVKGYTMSIQPFSSPDFKKKLYIDLSNLPEFIHFRAWKSGDRFQPFGLVGTKKISDYLTEKKVTPSVKKQAGVLTINNGVIIAVILPYSEPINPPGTIHEMVRCGANTKKCLVIERITQIEE